MEQYLGPLTFIAIIVFGIISIMIGWYHGRAVEREAQRKKFRMMGYDLTGVLVDIEHGTGFDDVCKTTVIRVRNALLEK